MKRKLTISSTARHAARVRDQVARPPGSKGALIISFSLSVPSLPEIAGYIPVMVPNVPTRRPPRQPNDFQGPFNLLLNVDY